jgi:hypothetical protein
VTDQRTYQREYARKRRAAKLAAVNASATTCQRRQGRGRCGARLEEVMAPLGRVRVVCPACARRLAGVCRDCPRPVDGARGRAIRCAACRERAQQIANQRSEAGRREIKNRKARQRFRQDAEARARKNAASRAWRMKNPEKVREHKRRDWLRRRETCLAYQRQYNEARREAKRLAAREYHRANTPAPQPVCRRCRRDIPWDRVPGRPPLDCVFCQAAVRPAELRAAIRRWAAHEDPVPAPPAPAPLWHPKQPARRNAQGERLCLRPGCTTVVQFRARKCWACKQADAQAATTFTRKRSAA